jgi:hypothetical protein
VADRRTKLEALIRVGKHLPQHPEMAFFLGFLAGNLDRLHFVRSLEGAPVAIRIAAGRKHIWPGSLFEAKVHKVPVPMPGMLVSALVENDEPICVHVGLDDPEDAAFLEGLTVDSYEAIRPSSPEDTLRQRMAHLHQRIDQALDVYRECRRLLEAHEGEDEARLRFFLGLAQQEIEALSQQLKVVSAKLAAGGTEAPAR